MTKRGFIIATVWICALASGANGQVPAQPSSPGQAPSGAAGAQGPAGGARDGPGRMMGGSMMTDAERQEHHRKMTSFRSAKECRAYVEEHHRLMAERARQRGMTPPAHPAHDPCVGLK